MNLEKISFSFLNECIKNISKQCLTCGAKLENNKKKKCTECNSKNIGYKI